MRMKLNYRVFVSYLAIMFEYGCEEMMLLRSY